MKDLTEESKDHQLTVALRIRPINDGEIEEGATIIAHRVDDQIVVLLDPSEDPDDILRANRSREKTFMFDVAFDHSSTQEEVYVATTKNLIAGVVSGYNATVFAYGPTGAGKTYTMLGLDSEPGIYILTLNDLFKTIEAGSDNMDYNVSMSYLEIYNEMIRDLLNPASGYLDLREDSKGEIQITGITEVSTNNAKEIMLLLTKGNKQRMQEPTAANSTSSRSHAVLQVTVKQKSRVKNITEEVRVGRLFMIDLAGTERASQTQNRGKRMKEGAHINRSLLALGNCINALSEKGGNRAQYVNYRDSKLTRLLKDSLGGNSRTVMIAHISPASTYFEESRTTLIYADRAKNIKTRVKRNLFNMSFHMVQYTNIIADLNKEIERLNAKICEQHAMLQKKGERANIRDVQAEVQQHSAQYSCRELDRVKEQLISAFREQMEIRRSLVELENSNMELHIDTSRHLLTVADWEREKARCVRKWREERRSEKGDKDQEVPEKEAGGSEDVDSPEPREVAAAREEIGILLAEERKTMSLKSELEQKLSNTKMKALKIEELLPKRISSEDQREILTLLCKVQELEVENTEMQSALLCKGNILRQKEFVIQHYDQHRTLCDEIIQLQKALIEDHQLPVPQQLEELYRLYFREAEEGNLDHILTLHSITSSALQDGSILNVARQLNLGDLIAEMDKDDFITRTVVHENRKLLHPRIKDCLSESDSNKVSTSKSHQVRRGPNITPPPTSLQGQPLLKIKSNVKERSGSRRSNMSLETESSKVKQQTGGKQMSPETIKEIVTDTKSISAIAARRRSRMQAIDSAIGLSRQKERSQMSVHSLEEVEEEPLGRAMSQPNTTPASEIKQAISIESVMSTEDMEGKKSLSLVLGSSLSNIKQESRKAVKRDDSIEKKARKKRSKSFEVNTQQKPMNHSQKHILQSTSDNRLAHPFKDTSQFLHSEVPGNPATPPATKIKYPISHRAGEGQLQKLEMRGTHLSTVHQKNAEGSKGQILQKRVREPVASSSTHPLLLHPGNFKRQYNVNPRRRGVTTENAIKGNNRNKK
ncbi:kinesin-like protein KIF19 isoform X2 [Polyodon spathula]|uniref:kinesin-like protein KIF19 isoform X2 n=1 Tax=Polyodon spathula TaxID=7913 RepID=UPI001B7F7629|nr:kinesin-like protein KIF19 isoform X2 [Polyodon spathula]